MFGFRPNFGLNFLSSVLNLSLRPNLRGLVLSSVFVYVSRDRGSGLRYVMLPILWPVNLLPRPIA